MLNDRTANRTFVLICLLQLLFWTVGPALLRGHLPYDTSEGLAWGMQWQWGYYKHPMLAPWLTALATVITGQIGWPQYLISQLCVVGTLASVYQLAKKIFSPTYALMSVMLIMGIDFYHMSSTEFNPNTVMLMLWMMIIASFYFALQQSSLKKWVGFGVLAGLGILAKYETGVLLAICFFYLLLTQVGRQALRQKTPLLSLIPFTLVVLPNLWWLAHHDFISISYAIGRGEHKELHQVPQLINHLYQPLRFLGEQLATALPMLLISIPLWRAPRQDALAISEFDKQFLWIFGLGPLLLVCLIAAGTGMVMHAMWAYPMMSLFGVLFLLWRKPEVNRQVWRRFVFSFVLIVGLAFGIRMTYMATRPHLAKKTSSANYPGRLLAKTLTKQWHERYHRPLRFVAGKLIPVDSVVIYSSDKPQPFFRWDLKTSPWLTDAIVREHGAIFVWNGWKSLPADVKRRFPAIEIGPMQKFPQVTSAAVPPVVLNVAFLPPADRLQNPASSR